MPETMTGAYDPGAMGSSSKATTSPGMSAALSPAENKSVEAIFVFTREAIRELDRQAVEQFAMPSIVLMENAARQVADEAMRWLEKSPGTPLGEERVLIACGRGNNGGDGFAAARHLHNQGVNVQLLLTFDPAKSPPPPDAATNLRICDRLAMPIHVLNVKNPKADLAVLNENAGGFDLLIDALLGTGAAKAPRAPMDQLIQWMNDDRAPILAVDTPSGLDCETGKAHGDCIRAAVTVTFVGLKTGFLIPEAQPYLGEIVIADIGAPVELTVKLGSALPLDGDDGHTQPVDTEDEETAS